MSLVAKISHFLRLSERDVHALAELTRSKRRFRADSDVVSEGNPPIGPFVLLDGVACRYRTMADGRRQISAFILPGDFCGMHDTLLKCMDHSIATIGTAWISIVSRESLSDVLDRNPRINAALCWNALQEQSVEREHLVSLGRRHAHARVACLLCELAWRLEAVGLCEGNEVRLPMTQADLADALGLTPVHVNRVLQEFRKQRLIVLNHGRLKLLNFPRLAQVGEVNRDYLHLDGVAATAEQEFARQERRIEVS